MIEGEAALKLPDQNFQTIRLDMSEDERAEYKKPVTEYLGNYPIKLLALELKIVTKRQRAGNYYDGAKTGSIAMIQASQDADLSKLTKLNYLITDLKALRVKEPNMHCVVFTHNKGGYYMIKKALENEGLVTEGFTSDDTPSRRSKSIRDFQDSIKAVEEGRETKGGSVAKVFVATMKIGNVGITLTAATRVYLFEPCIDIATEVQAAGRIHRLGQTKNVLVKRLVFNNSIESRIDEVHEEIKKGNLEVKDGYYPTDLLNILLLDR